MQYIEYGYVGGHSLLHNAEIEKSELNIRSPMGVHGVHRNYFTFMET
jgi:hypothetical protein